MFALQVEKWAEKQAEKEEKKRQKQVNKEANIQQAHGVSFSERITQKRSR